MKAIYWIEATRPKTLFASLAPVLLGTSFALKAGSFSLLTFLLTLFAALAIQIGANFANDYYDFIKGADTASRKGPRRLTQSGLISPSDMKLATFLILSTAALLNIYLIARGGPAFALLTSASIFLAVGYTGGPYPLAYLGLGEIFVFFFFGPIATASTAYLQTLSFSWTPAILGICPGLLATAILIVNNLRDIDDDRKANKNTLAVRFGKRFTQIEYTACLFAGCLLPLFFGFYLPLIALIPALIPLKSVWTTTKLNEALAQTGKIGFLTAILLATSLFYGL
jgi:1,4-dihydroxy-2-naphthoate octaprenyltransferase